MYRPNVSHEDHVDQLIRFMEVLAKLDADDRPVFVEALEMIIHPTKIIDVVKFT